MPGQLTNCNSYRNMIEHIIYILITFDKSMMLMDVHITIGIMISFLIIYRFWTVGPLMNDIAPSFISIIILQFYHKVRKYCFILENDKVMPVCHNL